MKKTKAKKSPVGKELCGLVQARHPSALVAVRRALAGRVGVKAAAETLEVTRMTIHRWCVAWKDMRKVVAAGTLSHVEAGALSHVEAGTMALDVK